MALWIRSARRLTFLGGFKAEGCRFSDLGCDSCRGLLHVWSEDFGRRLWFCADLVPVFQGVGVAIGLGLRASRGCPSISHLQA